MYSKFIKRTADFFGALTFILLFSPIIMVLVILLSVANRGTPFFFQKRPGLNGKLFTIIKFKTMNNKRDEAGNLLPDLERITPVGRFVRNFSLDELLQLFNVLIGDMSLVGPRPLLKQYLPLYNAHQMRRHEAKPGITGWAQVNGRNAINWDEKFKLDIWYVDHVSFRTDIRILWKTALKVFKREGITSDSGSEHSMPIFTGNQK